MRAVSWSGQAGQYEDLCVQLETIADVLVDRSIESLREAIEAGGHEHPAEEKQLAKAQRSIAKAVQILRSLDESPASE